MYSQGMPTLPSMYLAMVLKWSLNASEFSSGIAVMMILSGALPLPPPLPVVLPPAVLLPPPHAAKLKMPARAIMSQRTRFIALSGIELWTVTRPPGLAWGFNRIGSAGKLGRRREPARG